MNQIKLVILESPFAGNVALNVEYARRAAFDCCKRNESPQASHLLFTQFLDDKAPAERALGIELGLAWKRVADYSVFYTDLGWSGGMLNALWGCTTAGDNFKIRSLFGAPKLPATLDEETEALLRKAID